MHITQENLERYFYLIHESTQIGTGLTLVLLTLFLTFALSGLGANLLVILLEGSHVLTSLRELAPFDAAAAAARLPFAPVGD